MKTALLVIALLLSAGASAQTVTVFPPTEVPNATYTATASHNQGVRFTTDIPGYVIALNFYRHASSTNTSHKLTLFKATGASTGVVLATATTANETGSGWKRAYLTTPVFIQPGVEYVATVYYNVGQIFGYGNGVFTSSDKYTPPLRANRLVNGVYATPTLVTSFPGNVVAGIAYYAGVEFIPGFCGVFQ